MAVKSDQIAERVSQVISERTEEREDIERQISLLEKHIISRGIEKEFQRIVGSDWRNYPELVREVEEQRKIEDNALIELKKRLESEK
jgi:hypothetical protein